MKATWSGRLVVAAGLVLGWTTLAPANRVGKAEPSPWQERSAEVGKSLLDSYYRELPRRKSGEKDDPWAERLQQGIDVFKKKVAARYLEGTLQRLLDAEHARTRQAAVLALGLVGTLRSNGAVATLLHDNDAKVRRLAGDALWLLWFRADKPANNKELRRLVQLANEDEKTGPTRALEGLDTLIRKAPRFAEAYNQRAILYFRAEQYEQVIVDCQAVLKLNPHHFGAASGLARAYMKVKKPRAALKAFRLAYRINPGMEDVSESIRFLEDVLGEEGKK